MIDRASPIAIRRPRPRIDATDAIPRLIAYAYGVLLILTLVGAWLDIRLRWAIYLLPLAVLLFQVGQLGTNLSYRYRSILSTLLITCSYALAACSAENINYGARWYLFVVATPFSFIFIRRMSDEAIKIITIFISVGTAIVIVFAIIQGDDILSDRLLFVSSDPSAAAAGCLAFPAGACVIYFCATRQWKWALFSTVLLALGFKRIALMGTVLGVAILFIRNAKGKDRARIDYLVVVAMFAVGTVSALFIEDLFYRFVEAFLPAGASVNAWTMGRYELTQALVKDLSERGVVSLIFGKGPGYSEMLTTQATLLLSNPHDDYLLLLIDLGIFGAVINVVAWLVLNGGSAVSLALAGYTAVLYLTDNTYIYFFHTFVVTAIVFTFARGGDAAAGERALRSTVSPDRFPRSRRLPLHLGCELIQELVVSGKRH
jgi:hypothetical protein